MTYYKVAMVYYIEKILVETELEFQTWIQIEQLAYNIAKKGGHITKIEEMK